MKLYTVKEAADRLGAKPRAVIAWVQRGQFPNAYKLNPYGRTSPFRIPEQDIVAFEEQRKATVAGHQK